MLKEVNFERIGSKLPSAHSRNDPMYGAYRWRLLSGPGQKAFFIQRKGGQADGKPEDDWIGFVRGIRPQSIFSPPHNETDFITAASQRIDVEGRLC